MIFCAAAGAITWALVFSDPPGDSITMQPVAWHCFAKKEDCDTAAMGANSAFRTAVSQHLAACEQQPAGETLQPYELTPFGRK